MTAAARALGLAQSTVSEALAALERALGTGVVARRRGAHAIALTPAGRALLPHARRVLASVEDAQLALAAATRELRGSVGVIANESISTYLLPRALETVRERWPNTGFAVTVGTCPTVRAGLTSGRFEVGFLLRAEGAGGMAAPEGERGSTAVLLADVSLALFCGPEHPLLPRTPGTAVTRDRLAPYPVFVTDASGDFHTLLRDFFRADGMPGPRLEATGTIESVKRSVATNPLALGILPDYAIGEDLRARRVRALAVRPALPRVRLEAGLSGARPTRPAASELVDALRSVLGGKPAGS